jgi:hypothetical protein
MPTSIRKPGRSSRPGSYFLKSANILPVTTVHNSKHHYGGEKGIPYLPAGNYELTLKMDMIKDQHHEYPAIEQVSETFVVPVD